METFFDEHYREKAIALMNCTLSGANRSCPDLNAGIISRDDELTYALLRYGETSGIYLLEHPGIRRILLKVPPRNFNDLTAVIALYKQSLVRECLVKEFVDRRTSERPLEYSIPGMEHILGETYGIILYDEQITLILKEIAGFAHREVATLRSAMSHDDRIIIGSLRNRFIEGIAKKGATERRAGAIFELLCYSGTHSISKEFLVSRASLSYKIAYLKAHYPLNFSACL